MYGDKMFVFRLEELLEEKKIEIENLANMTGLSMKYLTDLKRGILHDTMLSKIYKLAKVMEVDIKELYYTVDDYEKVREKLEALIASGISMQSREVLYMSEILDQLQNMQNKNI